MNPTQKYVRMKTLLSIICFLVLLTACHENKNKSVLENDPSASVASPPSVNKEDRNKDIALHCIRSWNTGNIDEIVKHLAQNTVDYGDGSTPPARGIDTARMFMDLWRFSVEEYKSSDELAVADGDYVFIYAGWKGKFKNNFMGMQTAGKSFNFKDVDIFKFDSVGKITEHRAILFSTMLREVAAKPQ